MDTAPSLNPINNKQSGFTIVELIVVIVVIAILAAITIVAYNGIRIRAAEASMQSDLRGSVTALEVVFARDSAYPVDLNTANNGQPLNGSGSNILVYTPKTYGYCTTVSNPTTSKTYYVKSTTRQIAEGNCNAVISTFAGNGSAAFADGQGSIARVNSPRQMAIDASGVLYLSDYGNHRVRQISPSGLVSTLAGTGVTGSTNGSGATAQFYYPDGIDVDDAGTVYVADSSNQTIRKITSTGTVSLFAGTNTTSGFAEGGVGTARFNYPRGVAVAPDGTVYVADSSNQRIRQITPAGVVSTLAGSSTAGTNDGTGAAAQFNYPNGIALGADGTLYVADSGNNRIRKVTPAGVVTTLAGSASGYADGTGSAAQFNYPMGVAVDSMGVVYVSDSSNHRIRAITPAGVVTTLAGSTSGFADGASTAARFNSPQGLTIDPLGTTLYLADYNNHRIRKIDL